MLNRAQQNFQGNWTAIVLAVISIIQGLAFNDLASRLPVIISYTLVTHDLVPAAHFLLSFIVLLRIFQTYITAALDYDEWVTNFPDVLIIFVIGLIEYYVFSSLIVPGFLVIQFHQRISFISVLAAIGHMRAFASLQEQKFSTYEAYRRERRLQAINIGGALAIQVKELLVLLVRPMPNMVYVLIGTAAAAVLAFNMSYSIRVTFPPKLNISATVCDAVALAGEKSQTRNSNILVRQSQRGDEPALARLISDNFGYIFSAVFDTSPRMTKKILLSMLRAANGRIPNFGFRSFEVACDGNSAEVLGLLNSACSKPLSTALVYWPLIPAIILYHLGLYGLIRSWNNWNVIRDTVPEFAPDELYIQYIAVNTQFQGIGIGSRLLSRVYELCISAEKTKVVLDVRESNQKARDFFRSQGFREDMLISRFSDQVLGKGQTIRMVHNISATVSLS